MPETLDLLPAPRRRARRRRYFLRLGTAAGYVALALVVAAAVLLIPAFVFLAQSQSLKEARLESIASELSTAEEQALSARLNALADDAATLVALAQAPSSSGLIREALAVSRSGVVLTGIEYAARSSATAGTIALSGTAATRNALRAYELALESVPDFAKADLPVSTYAKDQDIPFTITITLAPPASP